VNARKCAEKSSSALKFNLNHIIQMVVFTYGAIRINTVSLNYTKTFVTFIVLDIKVIQINRLIGCAELKRN
jgi:hypothetical protein